MVEQHIDNIRVSSFDQNPDRQLEEAAIDRVFTDKAFGKDTKRQQLQTLVAFVHAGDTIVVHSTDRFARNLDVFRRIVQALTCAVSPT